MSYALAVDGVGIDERALFLPGAEKRAAEVARVRKCVVEIYDEDHGDVVRVATYIGGPFESVRLDTPPARAALH